MEQAPNDGHHSKPRNIDTDAISYVYLRKVVWSDPQPRRKARRVSWLPFQAAA